MRVGKPVKERNRRAISAVRRRHKILARRMWRAVTYYVEEPEQQRTHAPAIHTVDDL